MSPPRTMTLSLSAGVLIVTVAGKMSLSVVADDGNSAFIKQAVIMAWAIVLAVIGWYSYKAFQTYDLSDFGFTLVATMMLCPIEIIRSWDDLSQSRIEFMFRSADKGNFLERNHAQDAWRPIMSVESAHGEDWKKLRASLRDVFEVLCWEDRLPACIEKTLSSWDGKKLTCYELRKIVAKIFFELDTEQVLPDEDIPMIMEGVESWARSLSGKGVGPYYKKVQVFNYMKEAMSKRPGKAINHECLYEMSCIMQPLFVSVLINIPDVFSLAEHHFHNTIDEEERLKILSDDVLCDAFLRECLFTGHPFPLIERKVHGGCLGSYQMLCRYDLMSKSHSMKFNYKRWIQKEGEPKCPFAGMLFGMGPRGCQGQPIAMMVMKSILKHCATDLLNFQPSQGHGISGRLQDETSNFWEEVHKTSVIFRCLWKSSPFFAPLRFIFGRDIVGH